MWIVGHDETLKGLTICQPQTIIWLRYLQTPERSELRIQPQKRHRLQPL
jgi:hypothetical protein